VTWLVPLPLLLPLLGAALSVLTGRSRITQRIIGVTVLTAVLVISVVLLVEVDANGPIVARAGGWPAAIGITLVADRLATIMLVVAALMLLAVLVFAIGEPGAERNHVGFQSVYLVLAAGVSLAFLTADLFDLFVAFEMMLTASYVLLTLGGTREQIRAGMTYVVISLLASTLFVVALALLYSATGTLNMAALARQIGELPHSLQSAFAVLLVVVFGIKAALFPLFFWLPDSYPTAPGPITAVFAGLLTKVGIYAIIRSQTLFFPPDSRPATLLLVLAAATMIIGVLGAIAQDDVKRILSFDIVSQVGYMVMGLALFTVAGVAGAIFFIVQHNIENTRLFLAAGLNEHVGGSSRLSRLEGMVRTAPLLAVLFLLPALSLAGIPPLSGFVGKLALVEAGLASDEYAVVAVSLLVSLLTLFVMVKIWSGVFWSPAERTADHTGNRSAEIPATRAQRGGGPFLMVAPTVVLVICGLAAAVAAGPLYALSERTARDLLTPRTYVHVVRDQ
jgi:multicomponent Na+:H+ antiporter subunit D